MATYKILVARLLLLFLLSPMLLAAPATKRTQGTTRDNPIPITFDITNWPNIAEEDCYAMLCIFGGQRVW